MKYLYSISNDNFYYYSKNYCRTSEDLMEKMEEWSKEQLESEEVFNLIPMMYFLDTLETD